MGDGMVTQRHGVSVRVATVEDAEAIRSIYNYEVTHTVATFDLVPRSIEDQEQWIASRTGAFATVVATLGDVDPNEPPIVVGFGALSPYREPRCVPHQR